MRAYVYVGCTHACKYVLQYPLSIEVGLDGVPPYQKAYNVYGVLTSRGQTVSKHGGNQGISLLLMVKVSKGAKIRNRCSQVPHPTQDTNRKVINSQLDTTNESQEVSPFPAGDHKAHINRRAQRHSKHKTEKIKRSTKEVPPWNGQ